MNHTKSASSAVSGRLVRQNVALQFHGVRYPVTDVSRAVEFYTPLGFMLELQQYRAFATFSLGDRELLLSGPAGSGSRPMPDGKHIQADDPDGNPIELFEQARR